MTVKEVAKCLGVNEAKIRRMCEKNMIDCCVVLRQTDGMESWRGYKTRIRDKKEYEIMPEEIEYLDWWFNYGGREEYISRVHTLCNARKSKSNKRAKMTITIEEI